MQSIVAKKAITMVSAEELYLHVVESGSFKKAAEQLGLEPSSVSRKIAALEQRLNVKLLRRSTQRSSPTELGRRYYERLRRLVDEQAALEQEIRSGVSQLHGKLRIAAPTDFGVRFVVPVVRKMQRESSDLSIELLLGSHFENIVEQHLDVAVRIGELPDSSLVAKQVGLNARVLVASTDYIKHQGEPASIAQLDEHNFILYSPVQGRSEIEFVDGERLGFHRLRSNITVNSVIAVRDLVLEGAGLHLGPLWLFQDDIDQGRVVRLLPERSLKAFPIHVVYASREYLPTKVKTFTEQLATYLHDHIMGGRANET